MSHFSKFLQSNFANVVGGLSTLGSKALNEDPTATDFNASVSDKTVNGILST